MMSEQYRYWVRQPVKISPITQYWRVLGNSEYQYRSNPMHCSVVICGRLHLHCWLDTLLLDVAGPAVDWCCRTKLLQSRCSESTQICRTVEEAQDAVVESSQGNCRQGKGGMDILMSDR